MDATVVAVLGVTVAMVLAVAVVVGISKCLGAMRLNWLHKRLLVLQMLFIHLCSPGSV